MKIGWIAPKNTIEEIKWVSSFFSQPTEPYHPKSFYDVVIFLNITSEAHRIRSAGTTKICAIGMEPYNKWPLNYDASTLSICDLVIGYRNFAGSSYTGEFEKFRFFAGAESDMRARFVAAKSAIRTHDFVLFARHDPNIRLLIGERLARHRSLLLGPLFNRSVVDKMEEQSRCRYEWITENEINDYYVSEKVAQALLAGCVPIYYGCTNVANDIDPELFINVHLFGDPRDPEVIDRVIAHCLSPGVYERIHERILRCGEDFLTKPYSIESALVRPLSSRLESWRQAGFRARRTSWWRRF